MQTASRIYKSTNYRMDRFHTRSNLIYWKRKIQDYIQIMCFYIYIYVFFLALSRNCVYLKCLNTKGVYLTCIWEKKSM